MIFAVDSVFFREPVAFRSCAKASTNWRRPSSNSASVTVFMEMPARSTASMVSAAFSRSSVRLMRSLPCSRKALKVAGGMVFTVEGPISSST